MHDIVSDKLTRLISTYMPMEEVRKLKIKYQLLLLEPSLLFRYKKDWLAFLYAFRLYNIYISGRVSNDGIKIHIQQIKLYDTEFAEDIEEVLPVAEENSGIFSELFNELKKGRQYFVSYISTHSPELIEKAKSLKDKDPKLSEQLVDLISAISGHEIDSLMQCKSDCEDWLHYAVRYNIDFFINRMSLFLNGGFDNSSREQFKGLYKDFGDEKLRREMARNNSVRNLWFYNQQLRYLYSLIDMCVKAQSNPGWEGFRGPKGFWTDFDKYAKAFEKGYGNSDFAERLLEEKKKTGNELPQFWGGMWQRSGYYVQDIPMLDRQGIMYMFIGGEVYTLAKDGILPSLLRDLKDKSYLIKNFIHPAATALMKIFEERENELIANRNQKVRDLIKLLLGMFGVNQLRKFRKLLRRKKRQLFDNLIIAQNEFASIAADPLKSYDEYIKAVNKALVKISPEFIEGNRIKFLEAVISHLDYMRRQIPSTRFNNDKRVFMRTLYSNAASDYADIMDIRLIRLEHLDREDMDAIEQIIMRGDDIMKGLRIVEGYTRTKVVEDFVAKIDDIPANDFSRITNRTFELEYVKLQFDNELKNALTKL